MASNYKKLGQYIRQVSKRNSDLSVTNLQGVSITKKFIPSIANTIGTNMATYKKVHRHQFAYGPVTSRNGEKISVALLDQDIAIISQAYTVFEVTDHDELDPEYLMMWFRRPEFDRYARFKSHGSVREIFGWDEMCDVELPIPEISEQKRIVKEYKTITNRIRLNKQLNKKLEESVRTVYKHWFIDFEFPMSAKYAEYIGRPELTNKPYRLSGGRFTPASTNIIEIPEGWSIKKLNQVCEIGSSKRIFQSEYTSSGVPFYRGKEVILKKNNNLIDNPLFISRARYDAIRQKFSIPHRGDILLTAVGTLGVSWMVKDEEFYFKDGNIIWFKNFTHSAIAQYLYDYMQTPTFKHLIDEITIGSTQSAITIDAIGVKEIVVPPIDILEAYYSISAGINSHSEQMKRDIASIDTLRNILLSSLSRRRLSV